MAENGNILNQRLLEAEQELRKRDTQLRMVMKAGNLAMWELDLVSGMVTFSPGLEQIFGLSRHGLRLEEDWLPLVFEEDRAHLLAAREETIATGEQSEIDFRIRRPDGTVCWLRTLMVPMRNDLGTAIQLIGIVTDITQNKQTYAALHESEQRFRIMADGSPFPIWVQEVDGSTAFVNRAFRNFFGTTTEAMQEHGWQPLIHPEDVAAYTREFTAALREERTFTAQARVRRYDGEWRWFYSSASPRFSESGEFLGMVGSSSDITDYIRAKEEIASKNQELEQALVVKDKFFSIIAHDLRSPFIGFLVFIKMLREKIDKLSLDQIQRLSGDMQQSAENLHRLLENLLEWSLSQQGETAYHPVCCNLAEIVEQNIDLMRTIAVQKEIQLEFNIPEDVQVMADPSMIQTILRNLLTNALKFTNTGGRICIAAAKTGRMTRISIADTGIGMDQEYINRLFIMDKMSSRTGTGNEKGTGLGLLLCKEFVQKHGGEIWVESRYGQGTTFFFTLPSAKAQSVADEPAPPDHHSDCSQAPPSPHPPS